VKVLEAIALPLIICIITVAATLVTENFKRIEESNKLALSESQSVERTTAKLLAYPTPNGPHSAAVLTALLADYGSPGVSVLRAILRVPKGGVDEEVRSAATDSLVELIRGRDGNLAESLRDSQIEVLQSKDRFEINTQLAAVEILARTCTAATCPRLCSNEFKFDTAHILNGNKNDSDDLKAIAKSIADLKSVQCNVR
jgi:hypothetical protein